MRNYKQPIFAKRHYEAIAKVCRDTMAEQNEAGRCEDENGAAHLALNLAIMFANDNPAFSLARFRKACGSRE